MSRINLTTLDFSVGVSAYNNSGTMFFSSDNSHICKIENNQFNAPKTIFTFREKNLDFRGMFVSKENNLYVGVKGFPDAPYGRTLIFENCCAPPKLSLGACFWGIDDDQEGNIYLGTYHERTEPDCMCKVMCLPFNGEHWIDISDPRWGNQTHVHNIAVNPSNQFLYATLGDIDEYDGCWRTTKSLFHAKLEASNYIRLPDRPTNQLFSIGDYLFIYVEDKKYDVRITDVKDDTIYFDEPQISEVNSQPILIFKNNWIHKFHDGGRQFIGMAFDGDNIVISDDTDPTKNKTKSLVYYASDVDDNMVIPESVLSASASNNAWGCFFLERDNNGTFWTAVRPFRGQGELYSSSCGKKWDLISKTEEQSIGLWRVNHNYRDFTSCQKGSLSKMKGKHLLLSGEKATLISLRTNISIANFIRYSILFLSSKRKKWMTKYRKSLIP